MLKRLTIISLILASLGYTAWYSSNYYAAGLLDREKLIEYGMVESLDYADTWRPDLNYQPEPWIDAKHPIETYKKLFRGQTLVIYFPAHWCLTGKMKFLKVKDMDFKDKQTVSIVYDSIETASYSWSELSKRKTFQLINNFLIIRTDGSESAVYYNAYAQGRDELISALQK